MLSFCGCCSDIFRRHIFRHDTRISHHKSMASFVAAADQGCIICWRALQNLTPESQELLRYYARSLKPFEDSSLGFSAHPRHSTGAVSLCFTEVQISVMQLVDGFGKWCTPPGITLAIYSNPEHRLHMYEQGMIDDDANFTLRVIEKLQGPNTGIFRLTLHRSSGTSIYCLVVVRANSNLQK